MKPAAALKFAPCTLLQYQTEKSVYSHGRGEGRDRHKVRVHLCLHGTWCSCHLASQGGFESCVQEDGKKIARCQWGFQDYQKKENCYSLTQKGCQVHLRTDKSVTGLCGEDRGTRQAVWEIVTWQHKEKRVRCHGVMLNAGGTSRGL